LIRTRLLACGHCACSLVGTIKKGRYIYYHCSGYKGKCPEPYTREEILEQEFARILLSLQFDDEVMAWVVEALRQSHGDEKRFHEEAILRLRHEYDQFQRRIEAMYEDKLDGRVTAAFFDQKAQEWRAEQDRLLEAMQEHQNAEQSYLTDGVQLLELSRRAHELFLKQPASSKRQLLDFVLWNSTWKDGQFTANLRKPFDAIAVATAADAAKTAAEGSSSDRVENWLPVRDPLRNVLSLSRRTICSAVRQPAFFRTELRLPRRVLNRPVAATAWHGNSCYEPEGVEHAQLNEASVQEAADRLDQDIEDRSRVQRDSKSGEVTCRWMQWLLSVFSLLGRIRVTVAVVIEQLRDPALVVPDKLHPVFGLTLVPVSEGVTAERHDLLLHMVAALQVETAAINRDQDVFIGTGILSERIRI
jgi:hypothetical protein